MKVYVNVGEMWLAVSCGKGEGSISALIEETIKRSKNAGIKFQDKEVCHS